MASKSIRGQEVTLRFVVDGVQQGGSFLKVENWKVTPRTDLMESDFVGDLESEEDLQHHGFDFSFTLQDELGETFAIMDLVYERLRLGLPVPKIDIVAIYKYRSSSAPSKTRVCERATFKLDSHDVNGRKEYVKNSFSGKCRRWRAA